MVNSQTTQNPRRVPGRTQMAYTGGAGAMSQGHHPTTNQVSWSYGPLGKANTIAEGFVNQMAKGSTNTKFPAWKKSFHLKDDQVLRTNLVGRGYIPGSGNIDSSQSWFNRYANMGLLVGHTLEYNPPGFPQSTFGPLAAYPLYNTKATNGYTWIPDMEMRFGSQYLRWMGYYGCNVLREPRWREVWSRFTWPIGGYCNVYCATASSIYMYDTMGRLWAQGLQGELNGTPMTIVDAWAEAGRRAHAAENDSRQKRGLALIAHSVKMSYLYWDATQEGGDNTIQDRFKPMQIGSTCGRTVENLHYGEQTVLTP